MIFQFGDMIFKGETTPADYTEDYTNNLTEADLANGGKRRIKNGKYDDDVKNMVFKLVDRENISLEEQLFDLELLKTLPDPQILLDEEGWNLGYFFISSFAKSEKIYTNDKLIAVTINITFVRTEV